MVTEKDILHETANTYCVRVKSGIEIRVNASTHSVAVGVKPDLSSAIAFCDKLERYPQNLKYLVG